MRRYLLLGSLILGLVVTGWTCVTQVEPGERGVVMRFGRVIGTVGPGLYVGLPWGIDRVERAQVKRLRQIKIGIIDGEDDDLAIPAGQLLTGDHNLVNVKVVLQYDVDDSEVQQFVLYGNRADGLVARTAEAVLAEWVAGRGVDDVLLRGKEILPAWLKTEAQRRLDPYGLGVRIQVATVDLQVPGQVRDAFEAVSAAQTEIQTAVNAARQDAEERWSKAESARFRLEELASKYAHGVKNLAHVEADAFRKRLAVLEPIRKQHPDYLATIWWDEVTKLYTAMRAAGRLDLLDNRLAVDGIDILQNPLPAKGK